MAQQNNISYWAAAANEVGLTIADGVLTLALVAGGAVAVLIEEPAIALGFASVAAAAGATTTARAAKIMKHGVMPGAFVP